MKNKKIFITDNEWFETGALKNPLSTLDCELEEYYPELFSVNYDTKLLATSPPTKNEEDFYMYNGYREQYGTYDLSALDDRIQETGAKNILLNGFTQELFEYIVPLIKDTVEIIYFFKCPKIANLSVLSQFSNLKCVHIFYNNSLTELWDMKDNTKLNVISFTHITKLSSIEELKHSFVKYVHIDSADNYGRTKPALFEAPELEEMPYVHYMSINFTRCKIKKSR